MQTGGWRRHAWALARGLLAILALSWVLWMVPWSDRYDLGDGSEGQVVQVLPEGSLEVVDEHGVLHVVPDPDPASTTPGLRSVWRQASPRGLWLSLVLFGPVPLLASIRFRRLLAHDGLEVSLSAALRWTLIGNFFNFVVPGTTGGDVIKGVFVTRAADRKVDAVIVVVLDRVIGMGSMILLGSLAAVGSDALGLRWTGLEPCPSLSHGWRWGRWGPPCL